MTRCRSQGCYVATRTLTASLCSGLVLSQGHNHEYLRLGAEAGSSIGVTCLFILTRSGVALADFRPDYLVDLRAAQEATLNLASAKPGRSARKMRAAGDWGSNGSVQSLCIADGAER